MRFSVIIPVYNSEHTIARALRSVQNQIYKNFEVIIINDGSSDNTEEICKSFVSSDERFRYFCQDNKGVSAARNNGIDNALGEFLVFLDSDDAYRNNYLSTLDEVIQNHTTANNFWVDYEAVDSNYSADFHSSESSCCYEIDHCDRNNVIPLPALWNKAYRKSIIDKINLRMPEDLSLGEDFIFNYKYLDASGQDIVFINSKLYLYAKPNNNSLDGKYRPNLKDIYKKLEDEMLFHFKKWNVSQAQFSKYYAYVFNNCVKLLYNNYRPECMLSSKEKLKQNKSILKSKRFKEALSKNCGYINPLYKFAYRISSWRLIQILDKLVKVKEKMR